MYETAALLDPSRLGFFCRLQRDRPMIAYAQSEWNHCGYPRNCSSVLQLEASAFGAYGLPTGFGTESKNRPETLDRHGLFVIALVFLQK